MYACFHCGHPNPEESLFCGKCGGVLDAGAADTPVAPGTVFDEKYLVLDELGRGGMGVVYRGRDLNLDREVAIKILPEHFNRNEALIARFKTEARAMAALDHPNVVPIYAIGKGGRFHYFVMKFLEGRTLAGLLDESADAGLGCGEVRRLLIEVCKGLEHAHGRGLIHRDIKPANVMVGPNGVVTVMDFGLVLRRGGQRLTGKGQLHGTPEYIAPEQADGRVPASPATDVYALGVVAYELLSGAPPFQAETPLALALKHLEQAPVPLHEVVPEVDPELALVVERCLVKAPEQRYPSAFALRRALGGEVSERRRDDRLAINAEFRDVDALLAEYAVDVSPTGCFLRSRNPLPVGTLVSLRFTIVDAGLAVIEGQGKVVRAVHSGVDAGMGVRFTKLSDEARAHIERLFT